VDKRSASTMPPFGDALRLSTLLLEHFCVSPNLMAVGQARSYDSKYSSRINKQCHENGLFFDSNTDICSFGAFISLGLTRSTPDVITAVIFGM